MANIYVRSTDGNNGDDGSTWALAKATLVGATTIAVAGDTIYVSHVHNESTAGAITLTSAGTGSSFVRILCVNDGAEPPTTLATTAVVATTGASAHINFAGFAYCYGVIFTASNTSSLGSIQFSSSINWSWILESCSLRIGNTNTSSRINIGLNTSSNDDNALFMENTTVQFGATAQTIVLQGTRFDWYNTPSAILGTVPTTLFVPISGFPSMAFIHGVDLSAATSGKNLVSLNVGVAGTYRFANCKLGSSVSIVTGTPVGPGGVVVEVINCDSADTNYTHGKYEYNGSQTTSTTVVRNTGASDGTTPFSWQIIAARTQAYISSFITFPIVGRLSSTGSKTFTMSYIHGESSALTDEQIWMRLEYLGSGSFTISSMATDRKATFLATAANQTADTASDWDNGATARANSTSYSTGDIRRAATPNGRLFIVTTGGTSAGSEPSGFGTAADGDSVTDNTVTWRCMRREKVDTTVTVNEAGTYIAWVEVAANVTVYIDPLVVIT
jgi:hypothetical protein